jgi:hypothetical protein
MTKLLTVLPNEQKMVNIVATDWVPHIREKMTSRASRQWLEDTLCDFLRRGLIERIKVIEAADNGDEIADAALRRVCAEMKEAQIDLPPTLKGWDIKAGLRPPVTRGRGRSGFDFWQRDIGIACLVVGAMLEFDLPPTRNRKQRRQGRPSASSVVAAAVGRLFNIDEKRIEAIWHSLHGDIAAFVLGLGK